MTESPSGFPAQAFHPGFQGRTVNGTLRPGASGLRFEFGEGFLELPWSGLMLERRGHNDEHLIFQHPNEPGCAFTVLDPRILEHPQFRDRAGAGRAAAPVRTRRRVWLALGIGLAVLVGFLAIAVIVALSQKNRLVRYLADRVPVAWEQQLGNSMYDQIRAEGKIVDLPEYSQKLEVVSARLLKILPVQGYSFQFHVVRDTNLNAFALPGGNVLVNTGLIDAASRPEEIAGVLAHEIAHVTLRHGFRKIIDAAGLSLTVHFLLGDTTGLSAVLANGSQLLLRQKYSRDFEREADDQGWDYLVAAQIDPRGMIDFFKKLQQEQQRTGMDRIESYVWLSTHPTTQERIDHLEAKGKTNQARFVKLDR